MRAHRQKRGAGHHEDSEPRPEGTPLPRTIGAPATRALTAQGITCLEQRDVWSVARLRALHGVGPIAIDRLREAQAERGIELS